MHAWVGEDTDESDALGTSVTNVMICSPLDWIHTFS